MLPIGPNAASRMLKQIPGRPAITAHPCPSTSFRKTRLLPLQVRVKP